MMLTSWSMPTYRKLAMVMSTIGRIPARAAPAAAPRNPFSDSGTLRTRAPELLGEAGGAAEHAGLDVLAHEEHPVVPEHPGPLRLVDPFQVADLTHGAPPRARARPGPRAPPPGRRASTGPRTPPRGRGRRSARRTPRPAPPRP